METFDIDRAFMQQALEEALTNGAIFKISIAVRTYTNRYNNYLSLL